MQNWWYDWYGWTWMNMGPNRLFHPIHIAKCIQMHPNAISFIIVLSALKLLDRVSPGLGFAWRWRCAVTVVMKLLTISKQNHRLTQGVLDSISNPASFCKKFWSSNWRHARSPSRTNFNSSCGSQWKICELIRPPKHKRQMDRRCLLKPTELQPINVDPSIFPTIPSGGPEFWWCWEPCARLSRTWCSSSLDPSLCSTAPLIAGKGTLICVDF